MGLVTVNPDSVAASTNIVLINGLSVLDNLSDADDGTIAIIGNSGALVLGTTNPTIPSGAKIVSSTFYLRAAATSTESVNVTISAPKTGGGAYTASKTISPRTTGSSFVTMSPVTISGADIDTNNISIWITRGSAADNGGGYFLVSKVYVVTKYIRKPVVSVSVLPTPDGTGKITTQNRPTVQWSNNLDPDGGPQFAWNLKLFTAAQYGAGGFNPETSTPTYETGGFSTSTFSHQFPDVLPNGTYRAYVKTVQFNSNWSDYANVQFQLAVPTPGTPTLSASAENDEGRVRLFAASTAGGTTTSLFEFQYLDGESAEWKPMRVEGNDVGWVVENPATLYDYEAPNGEPQQYRVRAVHLFDFTTGSSSAWTNATVTLQTGWWLKHPLDPALNRALEIASFNGQQRAGRISVTQPLGREDAVATMDTRGPETGEVGIRVMDRSEVEQLQAITNERTPLLLQAAYDTDEPDRWVVLGDETVERLLDNKAVERRNVTYAWTRVKRPSNKHHQAPPPDDPSTLGTYTEEVQKDGPELWWRLNETSGTTLADSSGNGHTGKIYSENVVSNADVSFDGSPLITEDLTKTSIYMHGGWTTDANGAPVSCDNPGVGFRADDYQPWQPNAKLTLECWLYKISEFSFSTIFSGSSEAQPTTTLTTGQTFTAGQTYSFQVASTTGFPARSGQKPDLTIAKTGGGNVAFTYTSKDGTHFNATCVAGGAAATGAAVKFGILGPHPTWEMGGGGMMRCYFDVNSYPVGWVDWGTNNTGHPNSTFRLNEATHVVCTMDGTTGISEWFINGVSMGPQGPTGYAGQVQEFSYLNTVANNYFQFGHRGSSTSAPNTEVYDGLVDQIAVYEKILPQSRIAAHFAAGTKNAGVVQPPPIIEPPDVVVDDRAFFGISPGGGFSGLSSSARSSQLSAMKADGAKWVRVDIPWSGIETSAGVYNWTTTDNVINSVVNAGLWVWGMIGYTPHWVSGDSSTDKIAPRGTTNVNRYADFCLKVAQRYGATNKCHVFEVWNEPNIGGFFNITTAWAAGSGSETFLDANRTAAGDAYAALLKAAYPKLKQGDPDCVVLPGGTSPSPDRNGVASWDFGINPVTWYTTLYQSPRSCKNFMDALSHHPYHSPSWANNLSDGATTDWSSWRQMTGNQSPNPSIRQVMRNNSDGAKKIWIGEVGVPTRGTNNSVVDENTAAYMLAVDMAEWKKYADGTYSDGSFSANAHWAGPMCVYTWQDSEDDAAANPDWAQHEGLIRLAGGSKPSRQIYHNVATAWTPP
jgi:hypothetical protein